MPEYVGRVDTGLPSFPAGAGKGAVYTPLPQDMDGAKMRAHAVQTILAEPQKLYELWRNVELAPSWQEYIVSVETKSDTVTHWVLGDPEDPNGRRLEYDSKIVEDVPGKTIAWESLGDKVDESGRVTFESAPGGRGTRVTLEEFVKIPGGKLSIAAAAISRRTPRQIIFEDLRHFKQLAEAGEIPTVVKNPHGPRGFIGNIKERLYGENNPTPPGIKDTDARELLESQS